MKITTTPNMSSRASLKIKKQMVFTIADADVEKGRAATFKQPHFVHSKEDACWLALYTDNKIFYVKMLHSWHSFTEVKEVPHAKGA